MQIDDTNVSKMTTEEIANVLRNARNPVKLVIARVTTENVEKMVLKNPVVSIML